MKTKKEIIEFAKKHKMELALTGIAIVGGVAAYVITKKPVKTASLEDLAKNDNNVKLLLELCKVTDKASEGCDVYMPIMSSEVDRFMKDGSKIIADANGTKIDVVNVIAFGKKLES